MKGLKVQNVNITRQLATRTRLRKLRKGFHSQDGASLVEFAVVLPLLLLILTGIFAFGVTFNNYLMLTYSTGIASRQLSISRGQTTDPCNLVATTFYAAAPNLTRTSLGFSYTLNGTAYSGTSCSSTSTTTGAAGNLVKNSAATLVVTYPCSLTVYSGNLVPGCTLKSQTTELVQ